MRADISTIARSVLRKAADRFEADPDIWFQGAAFCDSDGLELDAGFWKDVDATDREDTCGYCAFGLISRLAYEEADGDVKQTTAIEAFAVNLIDAHTTADGYASIGGWNDDEERTVEDVITTLREVAS